MRRLVLRRWPVMVASVLLLATMVLFLWPLPVSMTQPVFATAVYAKDGSLLDVKIAPDEQWRFASPEKLPEKYILAVLKFEDRYFYIHPGVNPLAVLRAIKDNYRAGRIVSGASTLTMQVSRILLQHEKRSYYNKLRELGLALRLEARLSKDDILKLYATHAPMGGNIVGLQAASWHYFGRAPDELSWAEAALLAVLPNRPAMLYLTKNRDALKQRRDQLLAMLHQHRYLDDRDYELAVQEPLPAAQGSWPDGAPHLLDRLSREYRSTTRFDTTIDPALQSVLAQVMSHHGRALAEEGVRNLAGVVIDHTSLETVAYVGNITTDKTSAYVDIASRPRSTASVIKPLLYGLMLESGDITPGLLVPDVPTTIGRFSPENHDNEYRGAVPASQMLAQSLNVPAVHLLRQYGVDRFREQLQKYGLTTINRSADHYGLSLILGGGEASLWELAAVYARMANRVTADSPDGRVQAVQLLRGPTEEITTHFPLGAGAAWLTLQAMIEVARPGADSNWRNYEHSQVIAWKTGTSYGLRDAWAIGSNGRYTVGVWAGNADGSSVATLGGAHSAGPVLMDIFSLLGSSAWLSEPEADLKTMAVCKDDGYLPSEDCVRIDTEVPVGSRFSRTTPYHHRIFLSRNSRYRVHNGCESVSNMQAVSWFVLPPTREYYWKKEHSDYRQLPPWRKDCLASLQEYSDELPFDLVYPNQENVIYLPLGFDGKLNPAIFRAVHRDANASLYWHLDGEFIGETVHFHERTIRANPGTHVLVLVDRNGQRLERRFKILGEPKKNG